MGAEALDMGALKYSVCHRYPATLAGAGDGRCGNDEVFEDACFEDRASCSSRDDIGYSGFEAGEGELQARNRGLPSEADKGVAQFPEHTFGSGVMHVDVGTGRIAQRFGEAVTPRLENEPRLAAGLEPIPGNGKAEFERHVA